MMKLGFSLYPELHDEKIFYDYINQFPISIFERVFLSFLQLDPNDKVTLDKYKSIIAYCNQKGFRVFADLNPDLIERLGWKNDVMRHAYEFGLSGLRLDEINNIAELSDYVNNPYGIKIELNASVDSIVLKELLSRGVNLTNVTACHNFYPRIYTGLSTEYYHQTSSYFKKLQIQTAAFISADSASEGPWEYNDSLPTLEIHRKFSLYQQINWFLADGKMDVLILSNQFISKEEFNPILELLENHCPVLRVRPVDNMTHLEKQILLFHHVYRPDKSDYFIRSTQPRLVYGKEKYPDQQRKKFLHRGDIVINNQLSKRYSGELDIALCDVQIDSTFNFIGTILKEDLVILENLKPAASFLLVIDEEGRSE